MPMLNGNTLHVSPSAGGPLVGFILNILRGYNITAESIQTEDELVRNYQRFIEASKFGNEASTILLIVLVFFHLFQSIYRTQHSATELICMILILYCQ